MRFTYAESMIEPPSTCRWPVRWKTPATTPWSSPTASATRRSPSRSTPSTRTAAASSWRTSLHRALHPHPGHGGGDERLRFLTFVLKLPVRHPILVAKQATSTAVMTGNRLLLGWGRAVARGLRGPGRALRSPRGEDGRGGRHRPAPLAGGYVEHHGEAYDFPLSRSPGTERALADPDRWARRGGAAAGGPGRRRLAPRGGAHDDLGAMLERLETLRAEYGRSAAPFETHVISLDGFSIEGARRLEDLGVTDAIVGFGSRMWPVPTPSRSRPRSTRFAASPTA